MYVCLYVCMDGWMDAGMYECSVYVCMCFVFRHTVVHFGIVVFLSNENANVFF